MTELNYGRRRALKIIVSSALASPALVWSQGNLKPGPIKIGVLNDQTGPYSNITGRGSVIAAQMAVDEIKEELGLDVTLIDADHQVKPDIGAGIARKWYDSGVSAIFDVYHSGVLLAVQELAREKNKIVVASMASSMSVSGEHCSPTGFQWANDGYSLANLTVRGISEGEKQSWFFITVDYTAGHSIEDATREMIGELGGEVKGGVKFPLGQSDFSSYLLQAQASKADNVVTIAGGTDLMNCIKQASEFGIQEQGQNYIPFSLTTDDVFALGSDVTQGQPVILSFYWGASPAAQEWTTRFTERSRGRMPTDPQANIYSAVRHYLKAVHTARSVDGDVVAAMMKKMPVNDFFTKEAKIREEDGRLMRDMYFAKVKAPNDMKDKTDILDLIQSFTGAESFIPAEKSKCPRFAS